MTILLKSGKVENVINFRGVENNCLAKKIVEAVKTIFLTNKKSRGEIFAWSR